MFKKTMLLLLLPCLAVAATPEPQDLVSIRLAGTSIDVLPRHIDVISKSPEQGVRKLVASGGEKNKGDVPYSAYSRGILYIFGTPDSWRKATKFTFADGDVIYTFFVNSTADRDSFVKKYKLTKVAKLGDRAQPLYRAAPRYYVLLAVRTTTFTCAMHPKIMKAKQGKCPLCGMDLLPQDSYE